MPLWVSGEVDGYHASCFQWPGTATDRWDGVQATLLARWMSNASKPSFSAYYRILFLTTTIGPCQPVSLLQQCIKIQAKLGLLVVSKMPRSIERPGRPSTERSWDWGRAENWRDPEFGGAGGVLQRLDKCPALCWLHRVSADSQTWAASKITSYRYYGHVVTAFPLEASLALDSQWKLEAVRHAFPRLPERE